MARGARRAAPAALAIADDDGSRRSASRYEDAEVPDGDAPAVAPRQTAPQERASRIAQAIEEHDYNAPENQLGAAPAASMDLDC